MSAGVCGSNWDDDGLEKLWGAFQDLTRESLVSAVESGVGNEEIREDRIYVGAGEVRAGEVRAGWGHARVPVNHR